MSNSACQIHGAWHCRKLGQGLQWGGEIFFGDVVLDGKREREKSHPLASRETAQVLWTSQSTRIKEVSKIVIRLLIKRGFPKVGRQHPVEISGEAPVLGWGFLRPKSYNYGILKVPSFSGILYVA